MTPDRTQSNPRLSDALAEQTIAEADGEAAAPATEYHHNARASLCGYERDWVRVYTAGDGDVVIARNGGIFQPMAIRIVAPEVPWIRDQLHAIMAGSANPGLVDALAELSELRIVASNMAVVAEEMLDEANGFRCVRADPTIDAHYTGYLRARMSDALRAVRVAIAPPPRPVPTVVPGSALARFVEAADALSVVTLESKRLRDYGITSAQPRGSDRLAARAFDFAEALEAKIDRAVSDLGAARAALLAASEAETMPAPADGALARAEQRGHIEGSRDMLGEILSELDDRTIAAGREGDTKAAGVMRALRDQMISVAGPLVDRRPDSAPPTPVTHGAGPTPIDRLAMLVGHACGAGYEEDARRTIADAVREAEERGRQTERDDVLRYVVESIEENDFPYACQEDALEELRIKLADGCHIGAAARGKEGGHG